MSRARASLGASWSPKRVAAETAENLPRFLARDYPLDGLSDREALARFDVIGFETVRAILDEGRGVILVGGHFGAHVSALHWMFRSEIPLRLLVQNPKHVSRELRRRFNAPARQPQSRFFIRRNLPTSEAAEHILRARAALLSGTAVYLNGDIPWTGPNTRPGRLLGDPRPFLSVWADLAVLTGAPVSFVFAKHLDGGRYRLRFDRPEVLTPGREADAVEGFFARLREEVAESPQDAIPYLLWPCFQDQESSTLVDSKPRPRALLARRRIIRASSIRAIR